MALPIIPIAIGGGVLALLLLGGKKKAAPTPLPDEPLPIGPVNPGRKTRPDPFPAGAGEAITKSNPQNGMLIRTTPDSQPGEGPGGANGKTNLAAAEGDLHARPGDHIAVIKTGIKGQDNQGGEWWYVMSPSGTTGYTRAIDPQKYENFVRVREPTAESQASVAGYDAVGASKFKRPQYHATYRPTPGARFNQIPRFLLTPSSFSGQGQRSALLSYPPLASSGSVLTCASPLGCWLRASPNPSAQGMILARPGAKLLIDQHLPGPKRDASSPGRGGWARVRYLAPGMNAPVAGYVLSEWLA